MLSELITPDMIQVRKADGINWKDAISLSAQPLLEAGNIEPEYIKAMIETVEQAGPFINIGKHVAMPHARPEQGVNHLGVSILKLDNDVNLLDDPNHPVKLFICLASEDSHSHLYVMSDLATLLANKETRFELLEAKSLDEIVSVIKKGDKVS